MHREDSLSSVRGVIGGGDSSQQQVSLTTVKGQIIWGGGGLSDVVDILRGQTTPLYTSPDCYY